jgi:hypothetical protein
MKHWSMIPTSITICPQTRQVHRNHAAPHNITHAGSSGKQEVKLQHSQINREMLIALHMTKQRLPNDMVLHNLAMDWLPAGWQTIYSHTHKKQWRGLWPCAVNRGHFITLKLQIMVVELKEGHSEGCYTMGYVLFSLANNSQMSSHRFF